MPKRPGEMLDCVVVGGGPAGLTAALYLERFLRACVVVDVGSGRASTIPRTRNLAGFPDGLPGRALLSRMRRHVRGYGGTICSGEVTSIVTTERGFEVRTSVGSLQATAVVLATGVVNHRPEMPGAMHDGAVRRGLIRYCPVCDGYEARTGTVAVLGGDGHGAAEAGFLAALGADVTLLARRRQDLSDEDRRDLAARGVHVVEPAVVELCATDRIEVLLADGSRAAFDTLYPALGSTPRSELAVGVGAKVGPRGCLVVDAHQQTSVPGLYAIGDVVEGLDQIAVAVGQAAIAATAIHNALLERSPAERPQHP